MVLRGFWGRGRQAVKGCATRSLGPSVAAQGCRRLDTDGAARGAPAGRQTHEDDQQRRCGEVQRIARTQVRDHERGQWLRQKSGKRITAWAFEGDADPSLLASNMFEMEWPPRSGRMQNFPEVDRVAWFRPDEARVKLIAGQAPFRRLRG